MEKAFLLPLPKFKDHRRGEDLQECDVKGFSYWSAKLKRQAGKSTFWQETFSFLGLSEEPASHPLAKIAMDQKGQSLLHLAVLDDRMDCIALLSKDRNLLERRNRFGLTPLELALYLHKPKTAEILSGSCQTRSFCHQPNVEFAEGDFSHLEILRQPIYESREVLEEILDYTSRAKRNDAIGYDRIWMGVYYDKEIEERIYPKVSVRRIDEEIGYGVFARERILPCTLIGEYTGVIQERRQHHVHFSSYTFRYTTWEMGRKKYVIDAERMGNFTRFINHADNPNVQVLCVYWRGLPRVVFVSLKEIPAGGQILYDYGDAYWKQFAHIKKRAL